MMGRNIILASVCPQVFGLYVVKLCVTLVLIGGVQVSVNIVWGKGGQLVLDCAWLVHLCVFFLRFPLLCATVCTCMQVP